ncbi:MAG: glycosyltransferase [Geobacteraceae bacterium]|nr:glycosyltransferase [Geobacteraceae bacterium]
MVSVAIATYNGERYIYQQMMSIYNQSLPVDEVVISDDGSTDQTVTIVTSFIEKYSLSNWHIVVNKRNLGFSSNFLSAVRKTTGDIIFLSDQDDVWEINKVEVMSSIMRSDRTLCALSSQYSTIDNEGRIIDNEVLQFKFNKNAIMAEISVEYMIGSSAVRGCTMCIRKDVRDAIKHLDDLELNYSLGHDWYLSMIASILGKNYFLNRCLMRYRIHDSNASLGRLRKSTVLSSTNEWRNKSLRQVRSAHQYLLNTEYLSSKLTNRQKKRIFRMIRFFETRLKFTTTCNIFIWLLLLFQLPQYYQCVKQIKGAMQLYLADLFYAYNINWRLLDRATG